MSRFIATQRGLARGLNSSDPACSALPGYFFGRLGPALQMLLEHDPAIAVKRYDAKIRRA